MTGEPQTSKKAKGPVRRLFMDVMAHAVHQGWMLGLMDSAVAALRLVQEDARENLKRVPSHKLSAKAEETLTKVIAMLENLSSQLDAVSKGDDAHG